MWTSPHRIKVWFKPPLWGCCSWLILWQTLVKHRLSGHLRNKLRIEPSLSLVHGIYVPGSQLDLKPSSEAKLHFWSEGCATHKAEEQAHQAGNSLGVSLIKDGFFSPIGWVHRHCPHISWFGFVVVVCGWFLVFLLYFFKSVQRNWKKVPSSYRTVANGAFVSTKGLLGLEVRD